MKRSVRRTPKEAVATQAAADLTALVKAFKQNRRVTYGGKGFGSTALKIKGRIFAMRSSKGEFVIKLPAERVRALVKSGKGEYFEPARGRRMQEWLVVRLPKSQWLKLAMEARDFVQRGTPRASRSR